MAADLKRGRGSPRHGREDEDGVDSDSCGSDAESEDDQNCDSTQNLLS